jgi:hypothetical protein
VPASLQITSAAGTSKVFIQSPKVVVGSGAESDIKLEDPKVSKAHCAILKTAAGYTVMNLAGQAPTAVNGKAVAKAALKSGDVITVGTTKIVFSADGKTGAAPAAKAATGPVKKPVVVKGSAIETAETLAMKPAGRGTGTQAVPKAGTQAMAKPATGKTPAAAGTGKVGKPAAGRRPLGRPARAARRSPDERRSKALLKVAQGRKKKTWPALVLLAAALAAVGAAGWYFSPRSGESDAEAALKAAKALVASAQEAKSKGELKAALGDLEEALKRAEEAGEAGGSVKADAKVEKSAVEQMIGLDKAGRARFEDLKKQLDEATGEQFAELKRKLGELQSEYKERGAFCPWTRELPGLLTKVDAQISTYNLVQKVTWRRYLEETVEPLLAEGKFAEARRKVEGQVESFRAATDQKQAREFLQEGLVSAANTWWSEKGGPALRKFQRAGDFDGAQKYLQDQLPNVQQTPLHEKLTKSLESIRQKKWPE